MDLSQISNPIYQLRLQRLDNSQVNTIKNQINPIQEYTFPDYSNLERAKEVAELQDLEKSKESKTPKESETSEIIVEATTDPVALGVSDYNPETTTSSAPSGNSGTYHYSDKKTFVKDMTEALKKQGFQNEETIKALVAQLALESGNGAKHQSNHNYGNITAQAGYKGQVHQGNDHDGKGNKIKAKFRRYNSLDEGIKDYVNLIKNKRYKIVDGDSADTIFDKLVAGGYAASPNYKTNLKSFYLHMKYGGKFII